MQKTFGDLGRHRAESGLQPCRVELGCRQQRAELVVQLTREPAALVFARGLQVLGQFGELRGAGLDLGFETIALDLHCQLLLKLNLGQHHALPEIERHRQQADQRGQRDADAVDQQGALDALALAVHPLRFEVQQRA